MTENKCGVIIQHGCGHKIFLSKEALEKICALLCSGCGSLISLSLFGSKRKEKLIALCENYTEKELDAKRGQNHD